MGDKILNIIIIVIVILIVVFAVLLLNKDKIIDNSSFTLVGDNVTLQYNEEYSESGCTCFDREGNDISNTIQISDNIDIKKPGLYQVTYQCGDKTLTRDVTVSEPASYELKINYEIDKTEPTNENITISYSITGETFVNATLPNGTITQERMGVLTVEENGLYTIQASNIKYDVFKEEINIENIDKEKPTGECTATLKMQNTSIKVNAKDNTGLSKYDYYDNNSLIISNNANEYNSTNKTSDKISVKLYDAAGNDNTITCKIIDDRYYDPIKPPASEKVVFKEETDTLNVYITHIGGYYLTRIWVKDAYNQLNKAPSPNYGGSLHKPLDLLTMAMNNNHLQNKLIVGFNGSGFYLKNTFDAWSVEQYSAYNKTEVGTIVINNGKLIRNVYNRATKQWYITGITKDNKMVIFEDNVAKNSDEINKKQTWANGVISSGIRNTFNFAGPVILNGKKLTSFSKSMPDPNNTKPKGLQMLCQINENNFVLFVAKNETRNTAINKFLSLGCQTATNLDGGGSVALFYKSKNGSRFTKVVGGGRELPAAGYFSE